MFWGFPCDIIDHVSLWSKRIMATLIHQDNQTPVSLFHILTNNKLSFYGESKLPEREMIWSDRCSSIISCLLRTSHIWACDLNSLIQFSIGCRRISCTHILVIQASISILFCSLMPTEIRLIVNVLTKTYSSTHKIYYSHSYCDGINHFLIFVWKIIV